MFTSIQEYFFFLTNYLSCRGEVVEEPRFPDKNIFSKMNEYDFQKLLNDAIGSEKNTIQDIIATVDQDPSLLTRFSEMQFGYRYKLLFRLLYSCLSNYRNKKIILAEKKLFDILLERGADINDFFIEKYYFKSYWDERRFYSRKLLMKYSRKGESDVVELLIKKGANVNMCNHEMWNPLSLAIIGRHIDVCKILLMNGADPNYVMHSKKTMVMLAAKYGNLDIVKLLIDYGADYEKFNIYGLNAFMFSSMYENLDVFKFFLSKGLDPLVKNKQRKTIMEIYGIGGCSKRSERRSYISHFFPKEIIPDLNWIRRRNFIIFLVGSNFQLLLDKRLKLKAAYDLICKFEFSTVSIMVTTKTPEQKWFHLLKQLFSNEDITRNMASYL